MEQNGLYAEEYDENAYMEQEEEWEREGLLDPAWEKQQKKVSQSESAKVDEVSQRISLSAWEIQDHCLQIDWFIDLDLICMGKQWSSVGIKATAATARLFSLRPAAAQYMRKYLNSKLEVKKTFFLDSAAIYASKCTYQSVWEEN